MSKYHWLTLTLLALKAKRVKVNPVVFAHGDHYLVLVEPEKDGSGCSKASDVGGGKKP